MAARSPAELLLGVAAGDAGMLDFGTGDSATSRRLPDLGFRVTASDLPAPSFRLNSMAHSRGHGHRDSMR